MSARLVAEITADTAGFEGGLNRADAMVDKFTHKVSTKMAKAFGYGFLASYLVHIPSKMIEESEKISEGAAKLHVTTDEYQMLGLAAKDAGMEMEEFVRSNAKNGIMLDTLIGKLRKYKDGIKMTSNAISEWKEIGGTTQAAMSGVAGPIGWVLRKGYHAVMAPLNLGGAMLNSLGFGNLTGAGAEDHLIQARRELLSLFGIKDDVVGWGDSKALPLPSGLGQQKKLNALMAQLSNLEYQESSLKANAGMRASIFSPMRTDWQQIGAAVQRPGMVLTETERTNTLLEDIRKEQTATKEEIQKLRGGTG